VWGYVTCPGQECHNNGNGVRDCRVFAVEAPGHRVMPPGVYCLHTSCAGVLAEVNRRIRSEIGKAKVRGLGAGTARKVASPTNGPSNELRTARTGKIILPVKQGGVLRTARTGNPKALDIYARARVHGLPEASVLPSVPSVVASPPAFSVAASEFLERPVPVKKDPHPGPANAEAMGRAGFQEGGEGDDAECTLMIGEQVMRGRLVKGEWKEMKKL
jgi:hypothetical protein